MGVSIKTGYARINTLSLEAYNEGTDLKKQVEAYKKLNGFYPEVIITDKIYGTSENWQWIKELIIRYYVRPLGKLSAKSQIQYRKRKQKKEQGIRKQVEGKFGQGKNGYNLNTVRVRTSKTFERGIAAICFVMNLVKFSNEFLFSISKEVTSSIFPVPDIFTRIRINLCYQKLFNFFTKPWNKLPAYPISPVFYVQLRCSGYDARRRRQ